MIENEEKEQYENEYEENEEYIDENNEETNQTDLIENQNNIEPIIEPPKESKNAIDDYKKICVKSYTGLNNTILFQLRTDQLNIFLHSLTLKDINALSKIISKYYYFKHIQLGPYDPSKDHSLTSKKSKENNNINNLENNQSKSKKQSDNEYSKMLNQISISISKNLSLSSNIVALSLTNLKFTNEISKTLSTGIIKNKSLQALQINKCKISLDNYEILLKGLLTHESLEYLDLGYNNFNDKFGNMISRVIARQTQRRDQIVWAYGLRNEKPSNDEYTLGLISLSLQGNNLSELSADCISNSLGYDQYIRSIDLSNNNFEKDDCKKFIRMMRKNNSLLTLDMQNNPGYDEEIHARVVMKMSKNIKFLYQQFVNGELSQEEFENLKSFVDESFFDVDIPQEIIETYNSNFPPEDDKKDDENEKEEYKEEYKEEEKEDDN